MKIKLKPKTFGPVFAFFDSSKEVQYATTETSERTPHAPPGSPVDMLLASLAFCMVKSVEWAAKDQGETLLPFSVKVAGTKSPRSTLAGRSDGSHTLRRSSRGRHRDTTDRKTCQVNLYGQ